MKQENVSWNVFLSDLVGWQGPISQGTVEQYLAGATTENRPYLAHRFKASAGRSPREMSFWANSIWLGARVEVWALGRAPSKIS